MINKSKHTNRLLWTGQILLSLLFLFAGISKLVMPAELMQGPIALPTAFLRFIGVAETLGAVGLVLPGLFRIAVRLTSIAASGLLLIMIGATTLTVIAMGVTAALFPFIVGLGAATIAYSRWDAAPLGRLHAPELQTT